MRCRHGLCTSVRISAACGRGAFTVIELIVSIFIIGLLLALALSAVQSARESARRTQCASNLRQLGIAMNAYEAIHGHFPPGHFGTGFSQHVAMLPHLEKGDLYEQLDLNADPGASIRPHPSNDTVRATLVQVFVCPSDLGSVKWTVPSGSTVVATSYAGNFGSGVQKYGYNGMFRHLAPKDGLGPLTTGDFTDGLGYTAAMSEILVSNGTNEFLRVNWNTRQSFTAPDELETFATYCESLKPSDMTVGDIWHRGRPWTWGEAGYTWYNHVLTPNRVSCINGTKVQYGAYSAASLHPVGVNVVFADGRVTFVTATISRDVWRAYGSRNGRDGVERF